MKANTLLLVLFGGLLLFAWYVGSQRRAEFWFHREVERPRVVWPWHDDWRWPWEPHHPHYPHHH